MTDINPYLTLVDFILKHIKPEDVLQFRASQEMHDHLYDLLNKEKNGTATQEEISLINDFMSVEHIIRLAKAKANQYAHQLYSGARYDPRVRSATSILHL